jgi:hypothetical protein
MSVCENNGHYLPYNYIPISVANNSRLCGIKQVLNQHASNDLSYSHGLRVIILQRNFELHSKLLEIQYQKRVPFPLVYPPQRINISAAKV